jgi:DNA-binding YbaB/EbfC family protein
MAKKGRRPPPGTGGHRGDARRSGGKGMPDVQALLAQAAEMQAAMADRQQELSEQTFEGSSGGGMVKAQLAGSGDLLSVEIDPSVLDPDDPELLGDLVVAAVNQANAAMREAATTAMGLPEPGEIPDLGSLGLDDLGDLLR